MAKGKKASLGCLFWIALILLVVVLFLFNQENITAVIKRIQGGGDGSPVSLPVVVTHGEDTQGTTTPSPTPDDHVTITIDNPVDSGSEIGARTEENPSPFPSPSPSRESVKHSIKKLNLYYVTVMEPDQIVLKSVPRQISYIDAPLTETMNTLLSGPTESEKLSSLISLIPKGTQIKNVYVKGDTAYITFNEEFRFNSYGVPGLKIQLQQIVYTATEFSNIKKVQILINNKKVDYLAQEGVYIGEPLSRGSF